LLALFVERDHRFVVVMVDVGEVAHCLVVELGQRREKAPVA
jgi:hypothetical protein